MGASDSKVTQEPHMIASAQRPDRSHTRRLAALVGAVALVVASCGGSSSTSSSSTGIPVELPLTAEGSFTTTSAACSGISIYPSPDTATASPTTQVSFRNTDSATITDTAVTVSGSATGRHTGKVVADSDARGASFHPDKPFDAGETVTVTAPKQICGADGTTATFDIIDADIAPLPKAKAGSADERSETTDDDLQHFASEPTLEPPVLDVTKAHTATDEGSFFVAPKGGTIDSGPMIVDGDGDLVWFQHVPDGVQATDFRVQTYEGEPVLTWWQGVIDKGNGEGKGFIMDRSYDVVATVEAGNGYAADMHEFLLEPDGTAWVTIYEKAPGDLSSKGGATNAAVLDSIVQQIDIATGNVLFEWHSLDHVDADLGAVDYDTTSPRPYDYFHLNSIDPDGEGTILISARNTNAVYLLSRATGKVLWTLGGEQSTFEMGPGTSFKFQHDARFRGDHHVTIFDNETGDTPARIIALDLDVADEKASLTWAYTAPGDIPVVAQGNLQLVENGNLVAGWGSSSLEGETEHSTTITEYTGTGDVLFHAAFKGTGINPYRAYRSPWSAQPKTDPKAKVTTTGSTTSVAVSWNGATEVASWDLVTEKPDGTTTEITSKPRAGFETLLEIEDLPTGAIARALDADGKVLATTPVTAQPR
jgi:hypothetical protein